MIRILYNEKSIYLVAPGSQNATRLLYPTGLWIYNLNAGSIQQALDVLMISELDQLFLVGEEENVLDIIKHSFQFVRAGGGLVKNSRKEYLFIYRRNRWDLPKGKQEEGEDISSCAMREVREETGIDDLLMLGPLAITYHFYIEKTLVFKENHWFLMYSDQRDTVPQISEGISKVAWIHRNNIKLPLKNSYESIRDVFKLVQD